MTNMRYASPVAPSSHPWHLIIHEVFNFFFNIESWIREVPELEIEPEADYTTLSTVGRQVLWTVINLDDKANTQPGGGELLKTPSWWRPRPWLYVNSPNSMIVGCFSHLVPPSRIKLPRDSESSDSQKDLKFSWAPRLTLSRVQAHLCMYSRADFDGRFPLDLYNSGSPVKSQQWV